MFQYISRQLEQWPDQINGYMEKIINYYREILRENYQVIGRMDS